MIGLTNEQKDIKVAAREFAEGEFPDIAADCDIEERFPRELWKKACKLGFIGIFLDDDLKGEGASLLEHSIIMEEFWRVDPGCGNILMSTFGSEIIQEYGSEEQKEIYFSPLMDGKTIMGAVSHQEGWERGFQYSTKGKNEYYLNGSDKFVLNGGIADHLVIIAKDSGISSGDDGKYTAFIIERGQRGVRTRTLSDKLGIRATNVAEVVFEDVSVSSENIIGKPGEALDYMDTFLDRLNVYASAQAVGASQGCLEKSIKYSRKRVQFKRPIGWFQMIQIKIANMAIMTEAARNLCYQAAGKYDSGVENRKTGFMASAFARQVAIDIVSETLQIHGGYGYIKELDIERFYRDVQSLELMGESNRNAKLSIASRLIGKL